MIKHLKYSKGLHILTLCCFLMPFFNTSCEKKNAKRVNNQYLVTADESKPENILQETAANSIASIGDSTKSKDEKENLLSIGISEKIPVLKPVLNPSEDIYSGVGTVLDAFKWIRLFSTPICFLLLIIGLIAKYVDKSAKRIAVLLNILSFIFLLIAQSMSFDCEKLWGLWVTLTFIGALTIYDIYIARLYYQQEKNKGITDDIKIKILFLILLLPFLSVGQTSFVGKYKAIPDIADSVLRPGVEGVYVKTFDIKDDFTFVYEDGENPDWGGKNRQKQTIKGSWKSNSDTIFFFNKDFKEPKGTVFKYKTDQPFSGIKIVVKNKNSKALSVQNCHIDSVSGPYKFIHSYLPFEPSSKNTLSIKSSSCTSIYFTPKGYCPDYEVGYVKIDLTNVKSGTLIEVISYSTQIEECFNGKKYFMYRGLLREKSTSRIVPTDWTDRFAKIK